MASHRPRPATCQATLHPQAVRPGSRGRPNPRGRRAQDEKRNIWYAALLLLDLPSSEVGWGPSSTLQGTLSEIDTRPDMWQVSVNVPKIDFFPPTQICGFPGQICRKGIMHPSPIVLGQVGQKLGWRLRRTSRLKFNCCVYFRRTARLLLEHQAEGPAQRLADLGWPEKGCCLTHKAH